MGIPIISETAIEHYNASKKITAPLVSLMLLQGNSLPDKKEIKELKFEVKKQQENLLTEKVKEIDTNLSSTMSRAMSQARKKGASSWLSVLPLEEYGFVLNKGEFRDALKLRYGNNLRGLPQKCPCGQQFDVTHALNCKKGGFVIIRHNNIRDFEANLLKKVCSDVEIEPQLQNVHGEQIEGLVGDESRPDIRARGFWRNGQNAYFDVRVTNTNSRSQVNTPVENILKKHENEKKRHYNRRIMDIEHGTFTPLVFSLNGGIGTECSMFHKHVAEKIANKTDECYEKIISFIQCKLSFLIIRSCLLCIRGSRSHRVTKEKELDDFEIAVGASKCDV